MRIADVLDSINAQASVRVTERDLRLALNELVRGGRCGVGRSLVGWAGLGSVTMGAQAFLLSCWTWCNTGSWVGSVECLSHP